MGGRGRLPLPDRSASQRSFCASWSHRPVGLRPPALPPCGPPMAAALRRPAWRNPLTYELRFGLVGWRVGRASSKVINVLSSSRGASRAGYLFTIDDFDYVFGAQGLVATWFARTGLNQAIVRHREARGTGRKRDANSTCLRRQVHLNGRKKRDANSTIVPRNRLQLSGAITIVR